MEKFVVSDLKNYKNYHVIYYPKHAQNCISTMSTLLIVSPVTRSKTDQHARVFLDVIFS